MGCAAGRGTGEGLLDIDEEGKRGFEAAVDVDVDVGEEEEEEYEEIEEEEDEEDDGEKDEAK